MHSKAVQWSRDQWRHVIPKGQGHNVFVVTISIIIAALNMKVLLLLLADICSGFCLTPAVAS